MYQVWYRYGIDFEVSASKHAPTYWNRCSLVCLTSLSSWGFAAFENFLKSWQTSQKLWPFAFIVYLIFRKLLLCGLWAWFMFCCFHVFQPQRLGLVSGATELFECEPSDFLLIHFLISMCSLRPTAISPDWSISSRVQPAWPFLCRLHWHFSQ